VGATISPQIEGMILTGAFLATVIFVGPGIWLGGVVAGAARVRKTVRMRELPTHS
jgi:hypothetical protein